MAGEEWIRFGFGAYLLRENGAPGSQDSSNLRRPVRRTPIDDQLERSSRQRQLPTVALLIMIDVVWCAHHLHDLDPQRFLSR